MRVRQKKTKSQLIVYSFNWKIGFLSTATFPFSLPISLAYKIVFLVCHAIVISVGLCVYMSERAYLEEVYTCSGSVGKVFIVAIALRSISMATDYNVRQRQPHQFKLPKYFFRAY